MKHTSLLKRLQPWTWAALCLAASSTAGAMPILDGTSLYASVSAGIALNSGDLTHRIQLSNGPVPITLGGTTATEGGPHVNLTVGRQWHGEPTAEAPDPRRWRLEAQWWQSSLKRERFQTGQLNVGLSDKVDVSGLYGNALLRLWRGEKTQWWAGAGLGYARVSMPDATAASPGCGCLGAASGSGLSWRLTSTLEHGVSESTSVFGTITHTSLPTARTPGNAVPSVETRLPRPLEIGLGLRVIF